MKLAIVMASSVDGVIAKDKNDTPFNWNSKEDRKSFVKITKEYGCMIIGSTSFDQRTKNFDERLTIVLTRHPEKYTPIENVIFTSGTPAEIKAFLEKKGIEQAVVAGGTSVNTQFLQSGLIDELYLTIEPVMLGAGLHLSDLSDFQQNLLLRDITKLNDSGTLLLKYDFIK